MKHILFVDDDPLVLNGIRTMLRRRHTEWEMDFVESGAEAIVAMDKKRYDLICSDMRMPAMDGAQLLTIVSERWPGCVRIVLSGYAELTQTIRLVPIAHQYLSKPCAPGQFENVLARCMRVQDLLTRSELRALVGRVRRLPALPRTYGLLREAMAKPNVTVAEIAKIIRQDMAITAKLLQVANSAFFRLSSKVTKIEQAVSHLGFSAVRNLVMSVEVFSQWKKNPALPHIDLDQAQEEALKIGAVARALAKGTPFADDALVVGLLHDIGYLIFIDECPDELQKAAAMSKQNKIPMYEAERQLIGASHAEVGAYLLALWGLPYTIVEAVAHHQDPAGVEQQEFDLLAAHIIANAAVKKISGAAPDLGDPTIDQSYLTQVNAPFSWEMALEITKGIVESGVSPS